MIASRRLFFNKKINFLIYTLSSLFLVSCLETGGRVEGVVLNGVDHTTIPEAATVNQIWNFTTSTDYAFDNNYINLNSGQFSLNTVNTRFTASSTLFAAGTHASTEYTSGAVKPLTNPIRELDSSWTPHFNRLIGYWKGNESSYTVGSAGQVIDSSGLGKHGTVYVAGSASAAGLIGNAIYFPGTYQNRIEIPNAASTVNTQPNLTISMWFNPAADNIDWTDTFKFGACRIEMSGSNRHLHVYSCGGISSGLTLCTNCIIANSWNHVAASFSPSDYKIVINGSIVRTGSTVGAWTIGDSIWLAETFKGNIDEIALFDKAFSVGDMQIIYHRQRSKFVGHYDSKILDLGASTANWTKMNVSTPLPFGKEINSSGTSELSEHYPLLVNTSGQTGFNSQLNQNIIGLWHLNEASGATFVDSSSSPNSLAGINTVTTARPGQFGNAVYLNGTNQYFRASNTGAKYSFPNQSFSVSMWFKTGATSSSQYLAALEAVSRGWGIYLLSNGRVGVVIKNSVNTSAADFISTESGFNDGKWHHVAVKITTNTTTQSGNTIQVFVDGKQKTGTAGYVAGTAYASPDNTYRISFGARNASSTASDFFQGLLDEVAIWNRSLDQTEILELYRRGSNRIKYQIKSCVDVNCNCKSYGASGSTSDCDGDGLTNSSDDSDTHQATWLGPDGTNATYYSEFQNSSSVDSSGNPSGTVLATPLAIDWTNSFFTASASPSNNQFFQFRAYMESDDETSACSGSPCLPTLTGVIINPVDRYYGGSPSVTTQNAINISTVKSISATDSSLCTTYQVSLDGGTTWKWWNGSSWVATTLGGSTSNPISDFTPSRLLLLGAGQFKIKAFLNSNSIQTQSCALSQIQMTYTQ